MTVLFHFNMWLEAGKVQIVEHIFVQKAKKKEENVEIQSSITNRKETVGKTFNL